MFLTEMWLQTNDHSQTVELCPPNYDCFNRPRFSGHGGEGLVGVFKKNFKCYKVPCEKILSFEVLTFKLGSLNPIKFAIVYRPPKPPGSFLMELPEFLSTLVLNYDKVVICGDFNIPVDDPTNSCASEFLNITNYFHFKKMYEVKHIIVVIR